MAVKQGKVMERELYIEVEGGKHYMPKGCDPIIGPQLEKIAGHEVEVLMAKDVVLAVRVKDEVPHVKFPVIVCYMCPPHVVFDERILAAIEPVITESLVKSGYLEASVVKQLNEWKAT